MLPVQVFLNNCRASVDLVTFQGAPIERMLESRNLTVVDGDLGRFVAEDDAALVGIDFAERKGLRVGQSFPFGGIDVKVAGIFTSTEGPEESLILTHLDFLRYSMPMPKDGSVTQFEVKVEDPSRAREIAAEIDALFATAEEPTDTRPQVAFLERATKDLGTILRFGRWLGLACVAVVLSLVANTVFMSVQERVKEFGVLRTLGFGEAGVATLVIVEAVALAVLGGAAVGIGGAYALLHFTPSRSGPRASRWPSPRPRTSPPAGSSWPRSSGAVAGLAPAVRSARLPIVRSLRS